MYVVPWRDNEFGVAFFPLISNGVRGKSATPSLEGAARCLNEKHRNQDHRSLPKVVEKERRPDQTGDDSYDQKHEG